MWDCPHCGTMAIAQSVEICPGCGEPRPDEEVVTELHGAQQNLPGSDAGKSERFPSDDAAEAPSPHQGRGQRRGKN